MYRICYIKSIGQYFGSSSNRRHTDIREPVLVFSLFFFTTWTQFHPLFLSFLCLTSTSTLHTYYFSLGWYHEYTHTYTNSTLHPDLQSTHTSLPLNLHLHIHTHIHAPHYHIIPPYNDIHPHPHTDTPPTHPHTISNTLYTHSLIHTQIHRHQSHFFQLLTIISFQNNRHHWPLNPKVLSLVHSLFTFSYSFLLLGM